MCMIKIENVSFAYPGREATLENFSLSVEKGECVLLCGESGCGKTTVTRLINGLIPHFTPGCHLEGSVTVGGMDTAKSELYQLAHVVGSVFQNPKSQFFNLDTDSELAFGLENRGEAPENIRKRLDAATRALHIERLLHRNIFSLSGGEKQALATASVYVTDPDVYVLDEPSANLDEASIEILRRNLLQLKAEGKTIIIAEHRLCFLTELIDRAVYMKDGRICRTFSGKEFLALTEQERAQLGLRALQPVALRLHAADITSERPVLIFDEPTSGLDYRSMCRVSALIRKLAEDGRIVIVVSHDNEFMHLICDCEIRLAKGENPYGRT